MPTPALSIVVVLHRSSRQAKLSLESLSPIHQGSVAGGYEVIVVEAASDDLLGEAGACALGSHIAYVPIAGGSGWRARAVAAGLAAARAPFLGLLQDGAHLLTPGVVPLSLEVLRRRAGALVVVADYKFDPSVVPGAGSLEGELEFLERSGWPTRPYTLFGGATYGPAAINGPLGPLLGASVLFCERSRAEVLAFVDPSLDLPGTGALRLRLFTDLCKQAGTQLVVLAGEGAFRLTHPEVTTAEARRDEELPERLMVSAVLPQGPSFRGVHREPVAEGPIGPEARPLVERSAVLAEWHCAVCRNKGEPSWYEDPPAPELDHGGLV